MFRRREITRVKHEAAARDQIGRSLSRRKESPSDQQSVIRVAIYPTSRVAASKVEAPILARRAIREASSENIPTFRAFPSAAIHRGSQWPRGK